MNIFYFYLIMDIVVAIGLFLFVLGIIKLRKVRQEQINNAKLKKEKQQLEDYLTNQGFIKVKLDKEIQKCIEHKQYLENLISDSNQKYQSTVASLNDLRRQSDGFYEQQKKVIQNRLNDFKQITSKAADNYVDQMQQRYLAADAAYTEKLASLKEQYETTAASLENLKETRKAAYEAILKQQEVKNNKQNYCLLPSSIDLDDIHTLEKIKTTLHHPRILSMLIWQTYWQPIAKKQFPIILQDKTKMGIYKITNLQTDQCYIGQAVDVYKRWNQHCKAGLGIDTPVGNKLYKAIQEYGLQNFAFELIIQCSQEDLNEKERYFIELYQSDLYGYNGQAGNKK